MISPTLHRAWFNDAKTRLEGQVMLRKVSRGTNRLTAQAEIAAILDTAEQVVDEIIEALPEEPLFPRRP